MFGTPKIDPLKTASGLHFFLVFQLLIRLVEIKELSECFFFLKWMLFFMGNSVVKVNVRHASFKRSWLKHRQFSWPAINFSLPFTMCKIKPDLRVCPSFQYGWKYLISRFTCTEQTWCNSVLIKYANLGLNVCLPEMNPFKFCLFSRTSDSTVWNI